MTVASSIDQDWQTWHAARVSDLNSAYGWLTIVGFDWLPPAPTALAGLPGTWWSEDGRAFVADADGLTLNGEPTSATSAVVAEGGSLSWLRYGERLVELVLRNGRYAVRQRDPQAATRQGFTGVPAYEVDSEWRVRGHFTPYAEPRLIEVATARDDLRQHIKAVGTVHLALGGSAYELVATDAGGGRLSISFHDETNGAETALWRSVTTGVVEADRSMPIDFNRAINLPFAFTRFGTCPAPVTGNRLNLPVTAGEKRPR